MYLPHCRRSAPNYGAQQYINNMTCMTRSPSRPDIPLRWRTMFRSDACFEPACSPCAWSPGPLGRLGTGEREVIGSGFRSRERPCLRVAASRSSHGGPLTLKICSQGCADSVLGLLSGGVLVPQLLLVDLSDGKHRQMMRYLVGRLGGLCGTYLFELDACQIGRQVELGPVRHPGRRGGPVVMQRVSGGRMRHSGR